MSLKDQIKDTIYVRLFGLLKVPLIWFLRPTVICLDDEKTIIKVPFKRKNKNHLGSLYFGALCIAADVAGGVTAMKHIEESGKKVSLSFKDFSADFLKRAEGDTFFTNTQGSEIKDFVAKVIASGERMNMPVHIIATTPSQFGEEPVATMTLTLSLKRR